MHKSVAIFVFPSLVVLNKHFSLRALSRFYWLKSVTRAKTFWKYDQQDCQKNAARWRIYVCIVFSRIFFKILASLRLWNFWMTHMQTISIWQDCNQCIMQSQRTRVIKEWNRFLITTRIAGSERENCHKCEQKRIINKSWIN